MQQFLYPARLRSAGTPIEIEVDGASVLAFASDSIATVLMAGGQRMFSASSTDHLARTLFCGMGLCHQCVVIVDGVRDVRACMTQVRPGMKITTHTASGDLR